MKLLVIDDNTVVRDILVTWLRSKFETAETFATGSGVEGLGYAFAVNPDIIIVDTTLPLYSGREVYSFLFGKQQLPSQQETGESQSLQNIIITHEGGSLGGRSQLAGKVFSKSDPVVGEEWLDKSSPSFWLDLEQRLVQPRQIETRPGFKTATETGTETVTETETETGAETVAEVRTEENQDSVKEAKVGSSTGSRALPLVATMLNSLFAVTLRLETWADRLSRRLDNSAIKTSNNSRDDSRSISRQNIPGGKLPKSILFRSIWFFVKH